MKYFFLFLIFTKSILNAQVNYETTSSGIYNFLERLSIKGNFQLNEEILPLSREYIAKKITENNNLVLTSVEKEELEFYFREYSSELSKKGIDLAAYTASPRHLGFMNEYIAFDKYNRFRFVSWDSDGFGFFLDPAIGYEIEFSKGEHSGLRTNGLKVYGNFGKSVGFDLQFYYNHYRGDYFDGRRTLTPLTGYEFDLGKSGGLDFNRMNANLSFSFGWGNVTLGKDFNYYGSGEYGKLILSDKAPSFPFLKIEASPVKWFRFSYIYGILNSRLIDSSGIRTGELRDFYPKVDKYYAAHIFSFTPIQSLNFSLGESIIYSDRFQPIYLIPVAIFRLADLYLTDPDESAGNAQLFASTWYKNSFLRTKFYGSILIDEWALENSDNNSSIGYNIGLKSVDPLIPESEIIAEYTRTDPFLYFHAQKAQTYQNYGYSLGHWIGGNADQFYLSFKKRILRGLNVEAAMVSVRKGSEGNYLEQPYQPKHTFLWGLKTYYDEWILKTEYEIIHTLFAMLTYRYVTQKSEYETEKYKTSYSNFISVGITYGI